jgi:hypothetical protein
VSDSPVQIEFLEAKMKSPADKARPPAHLRPETRRWFEHATEEFELEQHHVRRAKLGTDALKQGKQLNSMNDRTSASVASVVLSFNMIGWLSLADLSFPKIMSGRSCPFRKSYPNILMMQSGQDWDGDNDTGPLDCSMQGRIFL